MHDSATSPTILRNWISVVILSAAIAISIMDRAMLNLLIEPIKHSLHLSDTQISIVSGVSFGLFYCVFALILGRRADHGNRRNIIAWTVVVWSAAMFLTGLARHFIHLLLCRIGLAIGEAALAPASYSVIADMFPRRMLGRAISTFYAGSSLGPGIALLFGGAMIAVFTTLEPMSLPGFGSVEVWQAVLMAAGFPGLLIAVLIVLFVKEPARRNPLPAAVSGATDNSILAGVHHLIAHRALYGALFLAMTLMAMNFVAVLTWVPTYLIRVYKWNARETGFNLGIIVASCGVAGSLFGGWLADWFASKGHRDALLRSMMIMSVLAAPFAFSTLPQLGAHLMLAGIAIYIFCVLATMGTVPALLQVITPNRLRGQVSGVYLTVLNIATLALAPLFVALLTDYAFRDEMALGYSLITLACLTTPLSLVFFWRCRRPLRAHLNENIAPGEL